MPSSAERSGTQQDRTVEVVRRFIEGCVNGGDLDVIDQVRRRDWQCVRQPQDPGPPSPAPSNADNYARQPRLKAVCAKLSAHPATTRGRAAAFAAVTIRSWDSSGWETIARCPLATSIVSAPIRWANCLSASGGITSSWLGDQIPGGE